MRVRSLILQTFQNVEASSRRNGSISRLDWKAAIHLVSITAYTTKKKEKKKK